MTVKPEGGDQAPHLEVAVFARGLLKQVVTRMYFPDEPEANAVDPVLSAVEPGAARDARRGARGGGRAAVRHPPPGARRDGVLRAVTLEAVLVPPALRAAVSDRAWVEAMLEAERALANAEAVAGVIPAHAAGPIAGACDVDRIDVEAVLEAGRGSGNPAEPLVRALRAAVGGEAADYVHYGATSQDIVDSAAMLVARNAVGLIVEELDGVAAACAAAGGGAPGRRRWRRGLCSSRRCRPRSG